MKKEIYNQAFENKKITGVKCEDESITLHFADETTLKVETYHVQDCCEHVYGDFGAVKNQFTELADKTLKQLVIKSVAEMCILLNFITGYSTNNKIFVACYNSQNGYYSSNLSLKVTYDGATTEIDIKEAVEDDID